MPPLKLLEDEIGRKLAQAEARGELRSAPGFGKPFTTDEGWDQAPDDLRMGFKILKDAGVVPPEIALFHLRARLRDELAAAGSEPARHLLRQKLSELEQKLSLRLEALQKRGSL